MKALETPNEDDFINALLRSPDETRVQGAWNPNVLIVGPTMEPDELEEAFGGPRSPQSVDFEVIDDVTGEIVGERTI